MPVDQRVESGEGGRKGGKYVDSKMAMSLGDENLIVGCSECGWPRASQPGSSILARTDKVYARASMVAKETLFGTQRWSGLAKPRSKRPIGLG